MITLDHTAQAVPAVELAGNDTIAPGSVSVIGPAATQSFAAGQKVVLEVAGRTLELTTVDPVAGVQAPGTYLDAADIAGFGGKPATMRLYGWPDRRRKWFSRAGVLVWLPGLVGLILAAFGLVYLASTAENDRAAVADAAKDVQVWLLQRPAARAALAQRCLDGLAGRELPADVRIAGVRCRPPDSPWYADKDTAALITAVGGLMTAALGFVAAWTKLTFGQSP